MGRSVDGILGLGLWASVLALPGVAQNITLDGTLGPAGTLAGPVYEIDQDFGATVGENLFQSFGRFDLAVGERANFGSDAGIRNIFGRVTGGTASSIDGLLFTDSAAVNLFLINPSGIVFGPNARLDVGGTTRGSFFATTVDGVVWPDGGRFDGVEPQGTQSLLNIVGDPSGFVASQRQIPGIEVNGSSLGVYSGQSVLFLGGEVTATDGFLFVRFPTGGRAEIAGVVEAGTVPLSVTGNDWRFELPDGLSRANIRLVNTTVDVTAEDGGNLSVYGDDVEISDGSRLLVGIAQDRGFEGARAGELLIDAQGRVVVAGDGSRVANDVGSRGTGAGGSLRILAAEVEIGDGARLSASTFGTGDAGNVQINARDRVLFQNGFAVSSVITGGEGKGGNVLIEAPVLEVRDGAQLIASTQGIGMREMFR